MKKNQNNQQPSQINNLEGSETIPTGSTLNIKGSGDPLTRNGEGDDIVQKTRKNILKRKFIEKSVKKFGNNFDYSFVNYINAFTPIILICPIHGEFKIRPDSHLRSKTGCPFCYTKNKISPKFRRYNGEKMSFDEYVKKASEKHNNKFIYECENWVGLVKSYITFNCEKHGKQIVNARSHLQNSNGCPMCGDEKRHFNRKHTYDECIKQFQLKYGDKYIYPEENRNIYVNKKSKLKIICPIHGEFYKTAQKHLSGQECHKCIIDDLKNNNLLPGGYNESLFNDKPELKNEVGYLYYLSINNGKYFKIGISRYHPKKRIKSLKDKAKNFNENIELDIVKMKKYTLYEAFNKEQKILNDYKEYRVYKTWSTELFLTDIIEDIKYCF